MDDLKEMLDGYNAGYILEQKSPALAQSINKAVSESQDPFRGFRRGVRNIVRKRRGLSFWGN